LKLGNRNSILMRIQLEPRHHENVHCKISTVKLICQ